jgi:hypothetical protein
MQTLTFCGTKIMSTRTTAGQFKGQFKGAMGESSRKVQNANAHSIVLRTHTKHSLSIQWGDG